MWNNAIPLIMEEHYLGIRIGDGMKTFAYIEAIFHELNCPFFKGCYTLGEKSNIYIYIYKYVFWIRNCDH